MSPEKVHCLARMGLGTGRLWPVGNGSVWGSVSNGADGCVVCLAVIAAGEVEYQLDSPSDGEVAAHRSCYLIWQEESRQLLPPPG